MALAAAGDDTYVSRFRDTIRLEEGGRYRVNMDSFMFDRYGMLKPFTDKSLETFGPARKPDEPMSDRHNALARALQVRIEETVLHIARGAHAQNPSRNLVLTGGVALNCVANARVLAETDYENVWVPPCASDTGTPLGFLTAAIELHPALEARLFDEHGQLRRFLNVFVDEEDIRFEKGLDTPVVDGQTVSLLPAVAGG